MSRPLKWFGLLPERWNLVPIGALFHRESRKGFPEEDLLSVYREYGVIPKSSRIDNNNRPSEDLSTYQLVEPGDLVVNKMKAWQGSMAISRVRGIVSPAYFIYRPKHRSDDRYLHYLLRSQPMVGSYKANSKGIRPNQWDLDPEAFVHTNIPTPPIEEQRAIADYLDRETQKIDELITEQRSLIETLRERRQAVIDAEFGKLPKHRIPLRRYITFLTSGSRGWGDYYADSGNTFVRIGNLPRAGLALGGERRFVALPPEVTEGKRTVLRSGDLLFSITAYIGSVAVVSEEWIGAYVSQHVALCRLDDEVLNTGFIGYFALSTDGNHQLSEGAVGGTKVQLALDDIKALRVPLVPLEIQGRIVSNLDEQTSRIDELISESEDLIALSQERRAALITAAVTGQIDVRRPS